MDIDIFVPGDRKQNIFLPKNVVLTITIPDHLKTQEMCNDAVHIEPLSLAYVLDRFKTQAI